MKTCKMFSCPIFSTLLTVSTIRNKTLFRSAPDKIFVKELLNHGSRLLTFLKELENKVTTFVTVYVLIIVENWQLLFRGLKPFLQVASFSENTCL